METKTANLRLTVYASLFAALMVLGVYLRIPVGPVPIVLTNLFVLLSGILLGKKWGPASVGIYLLLGAVGLPVFSRGGGIALLFGPTGGYLLGYLPACYVTALVAHRGKTSVARDLVALCAGTLVIYAAGVPWLKLALEMTWPRALAAGMLPFLIGDALKVAAALGLTRTLQKAAPELFPILSGRMKVEPVD